MSVLLEPPLTRSGWLPPSGHEPVTEAPRFMRTAAMTRWHRPRCGTRRPSRGASFQFWCGALGREDMLIAADQVPDGEPVCGTCEGRAVGAGQDTRGGGPALRFDPRRLTPPAKCPGSRSERLYEHVSGTVGRCLACGELVALRSGGSIYNPRYGPVNHEPGPGLVEGCPFHAWSLLAVCDGRAVCECKAAEQ